MLQVAIVFTLGCSVLVCNAVLSALPLINLHLPARVIYVEGVLSVLSCSLFLLGSAFAFVEAWKDDEPSFPSKLQGTAHAAAAASQDDLSVTDYESVTIMVGEKVLEEAHHVDKKSSHAELFKHSIATLPSEEEKPLRHEDISRPVSPSPSRPTTPLSSRPTTPFPSRPTSPSPTRTISPPPTPASTPRRRRYLELQIIANAIFLASSALYAATSLASLLTILRTGLIARPIRYPQLLAASGFALASLILIFKIQKDSRHAWWKLKIRSPGLYVNVFNLLGSVGFVFCAYFGLLRGVGSSEEWFGYSYLWGSWAFFFGSCVEWWKARRRKLAKQREMGEWEVEKGGL